MNLQSRAALVSSKRYGYSSFACAARPSRCFCAASFTHLQLGRLPEMTSSAYCCAICEYVSIYREASMGVTKSDQLSSLLVSVGWGTADTLERSEGVMPSLPSKVM